MKKLLSTVLIAGMAIVPATAISCNASFTVNGKPAAHYEVCYDRETIADCDKNNNVYIICDEKSENKSDSFVWKSIKFVVKLALALGIPLATAAALMSKYSPNGEWGKWLGNSVTNIKANIKNSEFFQDKIVKNYNDIKNSDFIQKKVIKTYETVKNSDCVQKPYNFMSGLYNDWSGAFSKNYNTFVENIK